MLDPAGFMRRLLREGMDIEAVWSVGHSADARTHHGGSQLLAFANRMTLERLRKCDRVHQADVLLLVVTDGDAFESAWGADRICGSLARWGWLQVSDRQAYYDESRWAPPPDEGHVVRVRRTAFLLWRRTSELQSTA